PITPFFIAAGGSHVACNIQINKPICIVSFAFHVPDALEFLLTCKITNLTIRAELGCSLLDRSGGLTIQECFCS
ncbi:hypothetical protein ACJX0J_014477, partial [Zea mays]